jgi:hypothetical protein
VSFYDKLEVAPCGAIAGEKKCYKVVVIEVYYGSSTRGEESVAYTREAITR